MKLSPTYFFFISLVHAALADGLVKTVLSPFLGSFNKLVEYFATLANQDKTKEGSFLDELLGDACDSTLSFLGLKNVECHCGGDAADGTADATAECASSERCLKESTGHFCGTSDIFVTVEAGKGGLSALIDTCMSVDAGLFDDPEMDFYELCVYVETTDGLKFDSCEATLKGEACLCEVCDKPVLAFTFDCSMVNLSPFTKFDFSGPKVDACSLADFSQSD